MDFIRLGEGAILIKATDLVSPLAQLLSWKECLLSSQISGLEEVLLAYETLTLFYSPLEASYQEMVLDITLHLTAAPLCGGARKRHHRIPVCYESDLAPDLPLVAQHCQLPISEVVSLHLAGQYEVAGVGFSPGFGFLRGLSERLYCPRKASPRKTVPAGAVGVASLQTGVYPSETSGGWNLVGCSPCKMVDYSLSHPSLLRVGDTVTFYEISRCEYETFSK